jgi:hypothetical protein
MDTIALWISAFALLLGTLLGLKGWFDPRWGADLVRLQAQPDKPEGVAEFRATFGGMFAGLHVAALVLLLTGSADAGAAACWVIVAGWWGTAVARIWSLAADAPARHPFVRQSILIEIVAGALVAAFPLALLAGG